MGILYLDSFLEEEGGRVRRDSFPDPPQGTEASGGFGPSWGKTGSSRCMGSPRVSSSPNTVLIGLNDSQAHREVLTLHGSPGARTCQKGPREAKGSIQLGVIQYLEKVCFQTLWHQHGAGCSWGLFPCSPHFTSHQEGLG